MYSFDINNNVGVLSMDDGKANAVGHALVDAINGALDASLVDASAVVLAGRDGLFSAGFDLGEFKKGPEATTALVAKGAAMFVRLFTHPQPVVAACTGHAIAAGGFMLLAADTRIGATGDFKIGLNETAIGMTLPVFGLELGKARLNPLELTNSLVQARLYSPEEAVAAGFLDRCVAPDAVIATAIDEAARLGELPADAYAGNKHAIRHDIAEVIRSSLG